MRRYLQFAIFAFVVSATFAAGLMLQGGYGWPQPAELGGPGPLHHLDISEPGALAKMLAGAPYLVAQLFVGSSGLLDSRLHEYGDHAAGDGRCVQRAGRFQRTVI